MNLPNSCVRYTAFLILSPVAAVTSDAPDPSDTGDDTPAQDTTDPQQEIDEPDVQDTDGADFQDTDESDSEETADGSERQEVQEVTDGADTLADNESEDSPTPEVAAEEGLPTPMPTSGKK